MWLCIFKESSTSRTAFYQTKRTLANLYITQQTRLSLIFYEIRLYLAKSVSIFFSTTFTYSTLRENIYIAFHADESGVQLKICCKWVCVWFLFFFCYSHAKWAFCYSGCAKNEKKKQTDPQTRSVYVSGWSGEDGGWLVSTWHF